MSLNILIASDSLNDSVSSDVSESSDENEQSYQLPNIIPPDLNRKTMTVVNSKTNGTLLGYSECDDFIYGNAVAVDGIYYYSAIIIRDNEILLTLNDSFASIKHNELMVESIRYISSITDIDVYITFGPQWGIIIMNTKHQTPIFQLNADTFFIRNRLYSYDMKINIEYFKTYHNFLELEQFSITAAFDRILNNVKYRELYRSAIHIKNNNIPTKIENATCIICMAKPPIYALMCGHLLYCESCHGHTSRIKRRRIEYVCPMCKTTHYKLIRMYY